MNDWDLHDPLHYFLSLNLHLDRHDAVNLHFLYSGNRNFNVLYDLNWHVLDDLDWSIYILYDLDRHFDGLNHFYWHLYAFDQRTLVDKFHWNLYYLNGGMF